MDRLVDERNAASNGMLSHRETREACQESFNGATAQDLRVVGNAITEAQSQHTQRWLAARAAEARNQDAKACARAKALQRQQQRVENAERAAAAALNASKLALAAERAETMVRARERYAARHEQAAPDRLVAPATPLWQGGTFELGSGSDAMQVEIMPDVRPYVFVEASDPEKCQVCTLATDATHRGVRLRAPCGHVVHFGCRRRVRDMACRKCGAEMAAVHA